jgi:hypothetical protein
MTSRSQKPREASAPVDMEFPLRARKVKDMKKGISLARPTMERDRFYILECVKDASKTDEHHLRAQESVTCWGFKNVDVTLG